MDDDDRILVACGDVGRHPTGLGVVTACRCGASIVHDPVMEANIRREYPGREVCFECLSCCAARNLDPAEVIANTRKVLPEELADAPLDGRQLAEYLKKFKRN